MQNNLSAQANVNLNKRPAIAVLLSTYNGTLYIEDQIKSILLQIQSEDRIFIRDDGSTDNTLEKIQKLHDARIIIMQSSGNIGFAKSFMKLINDVPDRFDLYCLADQDDIWIEGKINRAIEVIGTHNSEPAMVCTRLIITDNQLNKIGLSPNYTKTPSFRNAICQNIATGCTITINKSAFNLFKKIPLNLYDNNRLYYHDWWIYLNISYFGIVFFDQAPSVLYRQHKNNQVGMRGGIMRYITMMKSIFHRPWSPILFKQLNLFCEVHQARIKKDDLFAIQPLCHGTPQAMTYSFIKSSLPIWQKTSDGLLFRFLLIFELITKKYRA